MEDNNQQRKKRRTLTAVIAVASIAVILFLCIFSLYHLPERDPVETPELAENASPVEAPATDFAETNAIMSASQEEVSAMLGELEMQYQNAKLNDQPYAAQQAGLRLALAYHKAGQNQQAVNLVNSLISDYPLDDAFIARCHEFLQSIEK